MFYDRNPGDARVKVGSERQAASSLGRANGCLDEIGYFSRAFCPRGPSKIGALIRRFIPKKLLGGTWAKRALSASLLGDTLASRNYAYNLMPSCSRQLRTNRMFSLSFFSPLGSQNCSENVPRRPRYKRSMAFMVYSKTQCNLMPSFHCLS